MSPDPRLLSGDELADLRRAFSSPRGGVLLAAEVDRLVGHLLDHIEALSLQRDAYRAHARHDEGCSAEFGYPCKCGFADLEAKS